MLRIACNEINATNALVPICKIRWQLDDLGVSTKARHELSITAA